MLAALPGQYVPELVQGWPLLVQEGKEPHGVHDAILFVRMKPDADLAGIRRGRKHLERKIAVGRQTHADELGGRLGI